MGDQYYNMKNKIVEKMAIVDVASEAMRSLNIEPIIEPIRGGQMGHNFLTWDYLPLIFSPAARTSMASLNLHHWMT